jgi:hypothetical protein
MVYLRLFLSLAVLCILSAVTFALRTLAAPFGSIGNHFHLMPDTPRSIFETRRMGLA